jgi:hypothetical protein
VIYDNKYDRSLWTFEFHSPPPGQNPAWWDKVSIFVDRVNSLAPSQAYDAAGFKFGYVDGFTGSAIATQFFVPGNSGDIVDLEALEAAHPETRLIHWTMGLARSVGSVEAQAFNQAMRQYAAAHGKVLMDIADIQSHLPDGTPCYDNAGRGLAALCDEYTDEVNGGHLNALGRLQMAKAFWVADGASLGLDSRSVAGRAAADVSPRLRPHRRSPSPRSNNKAPLLHKERGFVVDGGAQSNKRSRRHARCQGRPATPPAGWPAPLRRPCAPERGGRGSSPPGWRRPAAAPPGGCWSGAG